MGTKFAVIDEDEELPVQSNGSEPEKPAVDWRESVNHVLTIGLCLVIVTGLCAGSFYAGGFFLKPTYNQAKVDIAADSSIGEDVAESYFESTDLCVDGDKKHRRACRLLIKDATSPAPKVANAKVTVPNETSND